MNPRKMLLIRFRGCSHSRIVDRFDAARVIRGTRAECLKCDQLRTISEQEWVDPKKVEI